MWWDEVWSVGWKGCFVLPLEDQNTSVHMLLSRLVDWPFKRDVFSEKFGFLPRSICCSRVGTVLENPFN